MSNWFPFWNDARNSSGGNESPNERPTKQIMSSFCYRYPLIYLSVQVGSWLPSMRSPYSKSKFTVTPRESLFHRSHSQPDGHICPSLSESSALSSPVIRHQDPVNQAQADRSHSPPLSISDWGLTKSRICLTLPSARDRKDGNHCREHGRRLLVLPPQLSWVGIMGIMQMQRQLQSSDDRQRGVGRSFRTDPPEPSSASPSRIPYGNSALMWLSGSHSSTSSSLRYLLIASHWPSTPHIQIQTQMKPTKSS